MNQSTSNDDPVTIDEIKEILEKEIRVELKEEVISVLVWLNSDRLESRFMTLIELGASIVCALVTHNWIHLIK